MKNDLQMLAGVKEGCAPYHPQTQTLNPALCLVVSLSVCLSLSVNDFCPSVWGLGEGVQEGCAPDQVH